MKFFGGNMIRPAILWLSFGISALANTLTLNTTPLESSGTGPFTIDFQFDSGNGGDSTNTVTLSDFGFSGGSIDTTPSSLTGDVNVVSGPFSVTLSTDTSFYNDVQFGFTPGSMLSFDVANTSNLDAIAPDAFTFAIYDNTGNEIPTTSPYEAFFELDLPTTGAGVTAIESASSGYSVDIAAPTYQGGTGGGVGGTVVPEPSMLLPLMGLAGAVFAGFRLKRR
jgi:hypothetical protein